MPRTITTTVYTWDELSDDAKRRFWETGYFDFSSDGWDEFTATLKAFCDAFDASCWGWDVNDYTYHFSHDAAGRWDDCPDNPRRAAAWIQKTIWNEYRRYLFKGRYYSTGGKYINGQYTYKSRRSRVLLECDCPLTGVCWDCDVLQPMLDALSGRARYTSPDELIDDCLSALFRAWRDDIEWRASFDYFDETMLECYPEMEFTADGTPWAGAVVA